MALCSTKEHEKKSKGGLRSLIDNWSIEIKDWGKNEKLFLRNVVPKVDVDFVMYSYRKKTKKFNGLLKKYLYKTKVDLPVKPYKTGFKIKAGLWFISFFVVPEFKKTGTITFTWSNQHLKAPADLKSQSACRSEGGLGSKSFILDSESQSGEFKVSVLKDTTIKVKLSEGLGLRNFENYIRFEKTRER